ncbi:Serine/arginine-rich splicing factor SR45a [Orobanche hederae]
MTGLSPSITTRDIERNFCIEGKVEDVHLVVDPWSRESRGFGFVTMSIVEEDDRCIRYLGRSILEGHVIMVEKGN